MFNGQYLNYDYLYNYDDNTFEMIQYDHSIPHNYLIEVKYTNIINSYVKPSTYV